MKYTIILEPQDEGGYTVRCLELPGAISQGETKEEAVANINPFSAACIVAGSAASITAMAAQRIAPVIFPALCMRLCLLPRSAADTPPAS